MATVFSGTNTEKIDQLISAVIELRTSVRVATWVLATSLPLLVALGAFLVSKSYDNSSKIDKETERLERIEKTLGKLDDHLERLGNLPGRP